ncbi:MAG: hypothetical protein ACQEP7_06610 [bacterium]
MKIKKLLYIFISVFMVFAVIGCSSQQEGKKQWGDDFGPEWAQNPPEKEGVLFEAANAKSRQLNIALQRANLRATNQLGQSLSQNIKSWQEDYQQEMGEAAESEVLSAFESLTERVVDEELRGVKEAERAVREEEGIYNAWVLVKLDMEKMANQFSEMERLETEFSREQAREKLDKRMQNQEE